MRFNVEVQTSTKMKPDEPATCDSKNISSMLYDTACLTVQNEFNYTVKLFSGSSECIECDTSFWTSVPHMSNTSLVISTVHAMRLQAFSQNTNEKLCDDEILFNQHEVVSWNIKDCSFTLEKKGDDVYIPLYVLATVLASLLLILTAAHSVYYSRWVRNLINRDPLIIDMQNDLGNPNSSSSDSLPLIQSELVPLRRLSSPRILALDTFRGLTISLMIFVNYGGGKYWFFEHSAWNGLTIADIVFPWFAWVMGVSLVLSYRSKLRSCASRREVLSVSSRRAVILFILGLLVNMYHNKDLSTARFCGVLQRLALAYLVVSTLEVTFMKKQPSCQYGWRLHVTEMADTWCQWLVILLLVTVQVCVALYLPVPGCPTGYLGPGGAANHSAAPNCTGGASRYIDSLVFGDRHLYKKGPVHRVYDTPLPFDPEGLLGMLSTCLTVYLGVLAGYVILSYNSTRERSAHWIFWAVLTGITAGVLCDWAQEGGFIPINKQLWSLSFALLTSAMALFIFTILYILIDHYHMWSGTPFRLAGMNAILLYIGHIVTKDSFPWSWKPYDMTNHSELLAMNVIAVGLWLLIARTLHNNQVFLTI